MVQPHDKYVSSKSFQSKEQWWEIMQEIKLVLSAFRMKLVIFIF